MFLSCSYNFFNGEEHLIPSINSIRNSVDYITIVYQKTSNRGETISEYALDVISDIKQKKLCDDVYEYTPDLSAPPPYNETAKRKIGLSMALKKKCSHFFSMDADEFYDEKQMKYAKDFIDKNKIIRSYCHSFMHLKSPRFRALDTTNVCFITKINKNSEIGNYRSYVDMVDPTRRIKTKESFFDQLFSKKFYMFSTDEISMYHMNFVRKDKMKSKLSNTSTSNKQFLEDIKNSIDCWTPGNKFLFPGKGEFYFTEVSNVFETYDDYTV